MEPEAPQHLPVDDRLFRWLSVQIARMPKGSLTLEVEAGQLTSIFISGFRALRSPDELSAPNQPPCP